MQYDGVVPQPGRNALGERSETSLANSVTDFTNSRGFRYGCLGLDTPPLRKSTSTLAQGYRFKREGSDDRISFETARECRDRCASITR